ncbi:hypothetical protein UY3_12109 [Chelonia mydas]|uniref:Myb/SANT-like DNA-binding domain-containing protein n=1 Tax=Chelonia mydas TaxID=8469 RepID=M7BRD1_CHEMY|nr:hypothetical protein UY3_12109 [Chelonia mydas]
MTMQSSSAEVTMMESQNRKKAPAWTEREARDLIAAWEEESVLSELRSSFQNAKTSVKVSQGMKDRGHNRDPKQCRMKLKELRQAYQKTRETNGRCGSEPQTCRFYDELHAILGGSATTTPTVCFDSVNGEGGNTEAGASDRPYRGGQEHLGHDDDGYQAYCTVCCHKAMNCCCVAMQYRICQHPGDVRRHVKRLAGNIRRSIYPLLRVTDLSLVNIRRENGTNGKVPIYTKFTATWTSATT